MPSKKASFESKDPSYMANKPTQPGADNNPSSSPSFGSRDDALPADDSVEFTVDAEREPPGKATFESRDPSHVDYGPDSPAQPDTRVKDKASFYARDPDLGTSDISKSGKKKYMGVERRKGNRRSGKDRRSDVRFDLDKSDRRQSQGRREEDHTPKYW